MSLPFAFRSTNPLLGGKLWKMAWRISSNRKYRQRARLRNVDSIVNTLSNALDKLGLKTKAVERWKREMPSEAEMRPTDKYTMFSRYSPKYRKGVHKLPKWTRVTQRLNPPGF